MAFEEQDMPVNAAHFVTTHWSVVLAARGSDSAAGRAALEKLCQTYWYPLYAFVRRQGNSPADAEDLTQAFFERVLEKQYFADVDQSKGLFRAFLIAALKHFLADCRDRARAIKRGGTATIVHLDALTAEERYRLEPADNMAPDSLFDRSWGLTVVENAVDRLRQEWRTQGKAELFESLKFELPGSEDRHPYAEIGAKLGKTQSAIKTDAYRLRQQFNRFLRDEIQNTVAGVSNIDDEIRYLAKVWSGAVSG